MAGTDGAWRAIAGGPYSDATRGAAYVYRLVPGPAGAPETWAEEARFGGDGCSGFSVALAEHGGVWLAAVGATQGCVGGGTGPGLVDVFRLDPGGAWTREARLQLVDDAGIDFGYSVSLRARPAGGFWLAVTSGAAGPGDPSTLGTDVYVRPGGLSDTTWTYAARLMPYARVASGAGDVVIGGYPFTGPAGQFSGAAYAFSLSALVAGEPGAGPAAAASVSVRPNPARGRAEVVVRPPAGGASARVRVVVVDGLGRLARIVHEGALAGPTVIGIDVGGLAAGVYAVRASGGAWSAGARLVVVQ